jgi:hypothetical protein
VYLLLRAGEGFVLETEEARISYILDILDTCWIWMHHAFDVKSGLAAFLTNCCVFCVSGVAAPASTGSKRSTHL